MCVCVCKVYMYMIYTCVHVSIHVYVPDPLPFPRVFSEQRFPHILFILCMSHYCTVHYMMIGIQWAIEVRLPHTLAMLMLSTLHCTCPLLMCAKEFLNVSAIRLHHELCAHIWTACCCGISGGIWPTNQFAHTPAAVGLVVSSVCGQQEEMKEFKPHCYNSKRLIITIWWVDSYSTGEWWWCNWQHLVRRQINVLLKALMCPLISPLAKCCVWDCLLIGYNSAWYVSSCIPGWLAISFVLMWSGATG